MDNKNYILTALDTLKTEYGIVSETRETSDDKLVIVFIDNPGNAGERISITNVLKILTNLRIVKLVATESGWGGEVDTKLLKTLPDSIKEKILKNLMEKLQLCPAEYCHAISNEPFVLFGPEDYDIWQKAHDLWIELTPLRNYFNDFAEQKRGLTKEYTRFISQLDFNQIPEPLKVYLPKMLEYSEFVEKRATIILSNIIAKMTELDLEIVVFVGTHALVERICEKMEKEQISYVVIKPHTWTKHNQNIYEHVLKGEPLKKIEPGSKDELICEQCRYRTGWMNKLKDNEVIEYKEPLCKIQCELNDSPD